MPTIEEARAALQRVPPEHLSEFVIGWMEGETSFMGGVAGIHEESGAPEVVCYVTYKSDAASGLAMCSIPLDEVLMIARVVAQADVEPVPPQEFDPT